MKSFPLPIKAVVIDLDGTLLNTAPDLAHAAELMMADLGRPCPSLETISTYIGNGVSRLVKRVLTGDMDAEPDAALFEQAIASYQKHYGEHDAMACSNSAASGSASMSNRPSRRTRSTTANTCRGTRARSPAWSRASTHSKRWACTSPASPTRPRSSPIRC